MTYARARLWLGISGVGTAVVVSTAMLIWGVPARLFPQTETWRAIDMLALAAFLIGFLILMIPFDLLGGYLLPRCHGRTTIRFGEFVRRWWRGVAIQSSLFLFSGLAILAGGRFAGLAGALAVVTTAAIGFLSVQGPLAHWMIGGVWLPATGQLEAVWRDLESWGLKRRPIVVVDHVDAGFTGGVIGFPGREIFVVPRVWLESLSSAELAVAIGRRLQAVDSGSRLRGLLVAIGWILIGFAAAALVPGAGVRSVAQLVATFCGFTLVMFLGLLLLPTVSRLASYAIDRSVVERGVPDALLFTTLRKLDRLQDDEPQRAAWIERIFHPVPSLHNRRQSPVSRSPGAWHAARMMLFLSWSCVGLLSRAVHCNAGRPELWVMLPTD